MKKRLIAASDLLSVRWLSDPQITKDGSLICVTESRICADSGLEIQMIFLVSSETGVEIPPPSGNPERMWAGRWSPDGQSLAFLGSRNGDVQLWLWQVTRNEIEQLTEEPHGVAGPGAWSPDGQSLAYPFRRRRIQVVNSVTMRTQSRKKFTKPTEFAPVYQSRRPG